jgi:hypothetical protein
MLPLAFFAVMNSMPETRDNTFAAAVILTIESDIRGMTIFL